LVVVPALVATLFFCVGVLRFRTYFIDKTRVGWYLGPVGQSLDLGNVVAVDWVRVSDFPCLRIKQPGKAITLPFTVDGYLQMYSLLSQRIPDQAFSFEPLPASIEIAPGSSVEGLRFPKFRRTVFHDDHVSQHFEYPDRVETITIDNIVDVAMAEVHTFDRWPVQRTISISPRGFHQVKQFLSIRKKDGGTIEIPSNRLKFRVDNLAHTLSKNYGVPLTVYSRADDRAEFGSVLRTVNDSGR